MTSKQGDDKGQGTKSNKPIKSQSITANAESNKKGAAITQASDKARVGGDPLDPNQPVSQNSLSSKAQGGAAAASANKNTNPAATKASDSGKNTKTADAGTKTAAAKSAVDSSQRSNDPLKFVNSPADDSTQKHEADQKTGSKPKPASKKSGGAGWLIPLVVLVVVGGGGYVAYQYYQEHHSANSDTSVVDEQNQDSSAEQTSQDSQAASQSDTSDTDTEGSKNTAVSAEDGQDDTQNAAPQTDQANQSTAETAPESEQDMSGQQNPPGEVVYDSPENYSSDQGSGSMQSAESDSADTSGQQNAQQGADAVSNNSDSRTEALEKKVAELEHKLSESSGPNQNVLLLQDVAQYAQYAENEIQVSQNARNAETILGYAKQRLVQSQNPAFSGLVNAIDSDVAALKSADKGDISDKVQALRDLSAAIDNAPLRNATQDSLKNLEASQNQDDQNSNSAANEADQQQNADEKWYHKAWSWVVSGYHHVVSALDLKMKIEKVDEPDKLLLSQQESNLVKQQIKGQLNLAQQALVARQDGLWKGSLQSARDLINQYFDTSDENVAKVAQTLEQYAGTGTTVQLPSLERTRSALQAVAAELRSENNKPQD